MRIEFLTQDDSLYILPFFEEFLVHYGHEFDITEISSCRIMGKRSRWELLRSLLVLYGAFGLLRLLAWTAWGWLSTLLPAKRNTRRFYSITRLCRAFDIPFCRIGNPNKQPFIEELRARKPDLIVSVACPYILKETLLSIPLNGCINLHHAPLPRYKGMMPTFWQLYHGETSVGLSVHYMAEKVDEGAVLLQDDLEIHPGESLHQLVRRSKKHAAHCVATVLRQIQTNSQNACKLDEAASSYFTFPTHKQIREFRSRGLKAI